MRLREIQSELKEGNISYADCFDRESLVKRLVEAREGLCTSKEVDASSAVVVEVVDQEKATTVSEEEAPPSDEPATTTPKETAPADESEEEFDRESTLTELRTLRVKELKIKLSGFKVRWGTMIEKDEMVDALCNAMQERFNQSKNFSRTGELIPGTVVDVKESVLIQELGWLESDLDRGIITQSSAEDNGGSTNTPHHPSILLDVYATWYGPCQFLAPLLVEAAEELGPTVRMVKLDSDKYPRISSALKGESLSIFIAFIYIAILRYVLLYCPAVQPVFTTYASLHSGRIAYINSI